MSHVGPPNRLGVARTRRVFDAVSCAGLGAVAVIVLELAACGGRDTKPAARGPSAGSAPVGGAMTLATTTSTQDSGLLDSLMPVFRRETGIEVKVIAVGTGAALEMAARGNADAVLVHAPESERRYVEQGDLVRRQLVMHNDFLLVGPPADPAGAHAVYRDSASMDASLRAIARIGPFVSRGDASGTEKMELALWKAAGVDPRTVRNREATGQGMGATLQIADQHRGYTLTDRATYLALEPRLMLVPLVEGDSRLINVYHVYVVNPTRHPMVRRAQAEAFVDFLIAPTTQQLIERFGRARYGQSLFVPDAGKPDPAPPSSTATPMPLRADAASVPATSKR